MRTKSQDLINFFQENGGIARFSAMLKVGFHPDTLAVLTRNSEVEKIGRGLYRLKKYIAGSHTDLVEASLQAPRGVICLLSSLSFHEATNEIPAYIEMAIPRKTHAYRIKYPPVRFYRFDPTVWEAGIEKHRIDDHTIKVYSLAKTIADCFKFRNKIGINVARDALKFSITEKNIKPQAIMQYAKICRVSNIIQPVLEALI